MNPHQETIRARHRLALLISWPSAQRSFRIQAGVCSSFYSRVIPEGSARRLTPKGVRRLRDAYDKFLKECSDET